jgi:hypothetical protein
MFNESGNIKDKQTQENIQSIDDAISTEFRRLRKMGCCPKDLQAISHKLVNAVICGCSENLLIIQSQINR